MVKNHVFWCPTLSIYVASRDIIRARTSPGLRTTPPDASSSTSSRTWRTWLLLPRWTNTQEVRWKKNYQVWMEALKEFNLKGGLITVGTMPASSIRSTASATSTRWSF